MNELIQTPVSFTILIITILMSVIAFKRPDLLDKWMLIPSRITQKKSYFEFITSGFIHADMGHLFFNMFTFYFFAVPLESKMGPVNFLILYFASMIISVIPSYIYNRANPHFASLGASGAVSGAVFGCILYYPLSKIYIMFIPIGIPAFLYAILYLIYCIYSSHRQGGTINHSAHFWGSLSGLIITIMFDPSAVINFLRMISVF